MKFILTFITLLFVFVSHAQVYRHSSMFQDIEWKLSTINNNYFDESGNQVLLISKLYGLLNHSFLPTVDFSTEYILNTRQGATQSVVSRQKSKGPIRTAHMYLSIRPLEFEPLFLRIGLINQDFLSAPLLISDWTFLGLQQEYIIHSQMLLQYVDNLKFVVQQTIPSSDTDLEYLDQVQEIANFFTASLFASSFIQNEIQTEGSFTAFYFRNLSPEAVVYSSTHGNDPHPDYQSGPNAELLYSFYGFYTRAKARYNLFPELGLEFDASFIWNIGATIESREKFEAGEITEIAPSAIGYNLWTGLHIPIAKEVIMVLNLEYFDSGKNASPASYNSGRYAHSGRRGVILGVQSIFERYNVFFDMQYAIIRSYSDTKGYIGNPNYLQFEIGTEYEKI